ncbi:MAG: AMP-binding protein [Candidatus Omnitrophota bacterium]
MISILTMKDNLSERIQEAVSSFCDEIAIQYKTEEGWIGISYGEMGRCIESLVVFLSQKGIKKGDSVAICLENRPEWPLLFFSTLMTGAIAVPLNTEFSQQEMENLLNDSQAPILLISDSYIKKTQEIKCSALKEIVSVDSAQFKKALGKERDEAPLRVNIQPRDAACILYTSGTTDRPKGVVLSHRNLLANSDSLDRLKLFTSKDSMISILPLHHAYPLTVTLILPLIYGCKIIYPGHLRGEAVLKAMQDLDPTVFVAVPQIFYVFNKKIMESFEKIPFPLNILFKMILDILYGIRSSAGLNLAKGLLFKLHGLFGRRLRLFVSGGAKLDSDVEKFFFKLGFTILEGYGLTETSPVLTLNPFKKPKIGSAGVVIPDVKLKIEKPDATGSGEVVVAGPNIMEGYYKRQDLTREVIKDGWFYTGDLGYLDEEAYLFLTGRAKDVIVLSSGLNIYPEEVEEAYLRRAPIKKICVFDIPAKPGVGQVLTLWAVVVPDLEYFKKYGEVNLRAVIKERMDNVSRSLSPHQRLMGFSITLEELPHTLLGKVKRFEVRQKYLPKIMKEGQSTAQEKQLSEDEIKILESETARKIVSYLKKEFRIEKDIVATDLLELDLGIDSLGRIELASGLEQLFGIAIEDAIIGSVFTVGDLATALEGLLRKGGAPLAAGKMKMVAGPENWKQLLHIPPKKENLEKIDLKPGFGAWIAAWLFTFFVRSYFKLFYHLKVEGKENFPLGGPYILYVNHASYFDGLLVVSSLSRSPRLDLFFVGFRPYFNVPVIRNLIKLGRIIPLDFAGYFLEALRGAYFVLSNNRNLCLFPEGVRSLDGTIGEFKKGFGILAKETNARLIPVFLEGACEAWPRTSQFPRRHPITVRFGKVLTSQEAEAIGFKEGARDSYDAICRGARKVLVDMKDRSLLK